MSDPLAAKIWISIHAPRMGSDLSPNVSSLLNDPFQSTLPGWGATRAPSRPAVWPRYFNPRSPDGERRIFVLHLAFGGDFNPRSPDGERHGSTGPRVHGHGFQSTLPGWGATRVAPGGAHMFRISIHAPRMGSDASRTVGKAVNRISIHAPRMGSDRENGHLRPRYGQNHPFSTLIVSQIVVDVLGTVRKSQKTPAH